MLNVYLTIGTRDFNNRHRLYPSIFSEVQEQVVGVVVEMSTGVSAHTCEHGYIYIYKAHICRLLVR